MPKKIKYKGKIVEVVSVGEAAKMCERSAVYFRKLEKEGVLPLPTLRNRPMKLANGDTKPGKRLYTVSLVQKLKVIFAKVSQGKAITDVQKRQIGIAFQEEKTFLNTEPNA